MKDRDMFLTLLGMVVFVCFLAGIIANAMQSQGLYLFVLVCGILVLAVFGLYCLIKSAVKDALREYEKEKAEANGQK